MLPIRGVLRLLAVAAVLAVATGVVAMHQLSFGHALVLPGAQLHPMAQHHPMTHDQPVDHPEIAGPAPAHDHRLTAADTAGSAPDAMPPGSGSDHQLGAMTCLAVVGLVLLTWLLRRVRRRRCYPVRRPAGPSRGVAAARGLGRRALSLQELAISRT